MFSGNFKYSRIEFFRQSDTWIGLGKHVDAIQPSDRPVSAFDAEWPPVDTG
jgi:hypothetical protein